MSTMNCLNRGCENRDSDRDIKFMKCSACKKVAYCSKECQVAHWKHHKPICKALRENTCLPDMDDILPRMDELKLAFYGRHAPVSERIQLCLMDDPDDDSARAKNFAMGLSTRNVVQFSIEKFIASGDKGAVTFNIKYPYMDSPTYSHLTWIPRQAFITSLEPTLTRQVTEYKPEHYCVILFSLPSPDGLSIKVWSQEIFFSVEPAIASQLERTMIAWEKDMRKWRAEGRLDPT